MADSPGTRTFSSNAAAQRPQTDTSRSAGAEWRRALLLAFVGLPVFALLCVCAYGFIIWFMQILFWGPPT